MYKYRRSKGSLWVTHAPWHPRLLLKCPTWPCAFFGKGGGTGTAGSGGSGWLISTTNHSEGVSNCDGSLTAGAQKTQDSTSTIPARLGQHLSHADRASTVWKLELKLDGYWTFWLNVKITSETLQIGHWLNVSCWFLIEKMQYKKTIC